MVTRLRSSSRLLKHVPATGVWCTDAQISALCSLAKSYAVLALDFITAGQPELEEAWRCVFFTFLCIAQFADFFYFVRHVRAPRSCDDVQN